MMVLMSLVPLVTTDVQLVTLHMVVVLLVHLTEFYQVTVVSVKKIEDIMIPVKLLVQLVNIIVLHVQLMMSVLHVQDLTLVNLIVNVMQVTMM